MNIVVNRPFIDSDCLRLGLVGVPVGVGVGVVDSFIKSKNISESDADEEGSVTYPPSPSTESTL